MDADSRAYACRSRHVRKPRGIATLPAPLASSSCAVAGARRKGAGRTEAGKAFGCSREGSRRACALHRAFGLGELASCPWESHFPALSRNQGAGLRRLLQRASEPVHRGTETDTRRMAENREPRGAVEAELDPVEYTLRKRLPHRLPRRPNDIYVNMKTDFKAQLARCQKLLDGGAKGQNACTEIYIHGLGLAINRAINIALQLQAGSFGSLQVAANTSTVELVDELEPETDTREPLTRIRNNSAIHIRVFRVTPK
nr:ribonuclease P protein subunit p20 [Jaculus jaculus]